LAPGTFGGGFIGVDIFFVISGFLITIILLEKKDNTIINKLIDFYKRRIKRILPALIFTIIITLSLGYALLTKDEFESLANHSLFAGLFANNFLLTTEIGYFDSDGVNKPLLHLWSLSIEEQFYLIFPIIILALNAKLSKKIVIGILIALLLMSFLYSFSTKFSNGSDYYSTLVRSFELLSGSALGYVKVHYKNINKIIHDNLFVQKLFEILFVSLIPVTLLIKFEVSLPIQFTMIFSVLFAASGLLVFQNNHNAYIKYLFSNRLMVQIGIISFSLYLIHYPMLSFAKIINPSVSPSTKIFVLLFSFLISTLAYKFIERPARKISMNNNKKILLILFGFLTLTLISFITLKNINFIKKHSFSSEYSLTNEINRMFEWDFKMNSICTDRYSSSFDNSTFSINNKPFSRNFCIQNQIGDPNILLVGNSTANSLYPGFEYFTNSNNLTILSLGDCAFGSQEKDSSNIFKCSKDFLNEENQNRQKAIISGGAGLKLVVISGIGSQKGLTFRDELATIKNKISYIYNKANNAEIAIFSPLFTNGTYPHQCYTRPLRTKTEKCKWSKSNVINKLNSINFKKFTNEILVDYPNVIFFDTNNLFCREDNECTMIDDKNLPLLRDRGHLSAYGSKLLVEQYLQLHPIKL
jgi:peptidoglycan/LPS O-acetylase OafA/YrhL